MPQGESHFMSARSSSPAESDEDIYRSVQAGAQGYLLKGAPQAHVGEAIHTVNAGKRYFPRDIAARLDARLMRTDLTSRELEVLQMLARGHQ
jgi:DNA-binding NarL/FixJ family response regulator